MKLLTNGVALIIIASVVAVSILVDFWLPLLAVVCGLGFVLFTLSEPFKGLLVWVLLSPILSPYIQIPLPSGFPDILFERVMITCVMLGLLLQVLFKLRRHIVIEMIEKVMILFLLIVFLSIIFRSDHKVERILASPYTIPFLIFIAVKNLLKSTDDFRRWCYILLFLGLYMALYGIYQYVMHGSFNFSHEELLRTHLGQGRAVGSFGNAAEYGGVLAITFLWALYLAFYESYGFKRHLIVLALGFISLGIFFSMTRAVWIGFLASLFIIALFDKLWKRIFIPFMIMIAIVYIITRIASPDIEKRVYDKDTAYSRLALYETVLRMFMVKPIIGYGVGSDTFERQRRAYISTRGTVSLKSLESVGVPHNEFLFFLVQFGLIGIVPYIVILILIFRSGLHLIRFFSEKQVFQYRVVIFFWGVLAIYIVQGLFGEISHFNFMYSLFYLSAGILDGLRLRITSSNEALVSLGQS